MSSRGASGSTASRPRRSRRSAPTSASRASASASSSRAPCASCAWSLPASSSTCAASSLSGVEPLFVDCHSHVVPSGDDGAQTPEDGLELCDLAADCGTRILFATPHVWPELPLTDEREREIRRAFEKLRARARLELRLGFELTPVPSLLREDPARYVLEGTEVVLVEMPFDEPAALLIELAEHVEAAGLTPLVAHPERTEAIRD